jgi:hypothetical protein
MPSSIDNCETGFDFDPIPITDIKSTTTFDFGKFPVNYGLKREFVYARQPNDIFIAHDNRRTAIDNGAHGQFGLPGHADFAHENKIELRVERCRDFRDNWNATARQSQDHGVLILVPQGPCSKLLSSFGAVSETHPGFLSNSAE